MGKRGNPPGGSAIRGPLVLSPQPREDFKRIEQLVGMLGILCQYPERATQHSSLEGVGHLYQLPMRWRGEPPWATTVHPLPPNHSLAEPMPALKPSPPTSVLSLSPGMDSSAPPDTLRLLSLILGVGLTLTPNDPPDSCLSQPRPQALLCPALTPAQSRPWPASGTSQVDAQAPKQLSQGSADEASGAAETRRWLPPAPGRWHSRRTAVSSLATPKSPRPKP